MFRYLFEVKSLLVLIFIKNNLVNSRSLLNSNTHTVLDSPFHYKLVKTNLFRPVHKVYILSNQRVPNAFPGTLLKKNRYFTKKLFIGFV